MRLEFIHDHKNAVVEWKKRDQFEWITDVFEAPAVKLGPGSTAVIRSHIADEFTEQGWAMNVRIDQELNNTVTAVKDDLAFQVQTGNMSRAPYDLLKLQYLYRSQKIKAAAMALPTKFGASQIGSNIAYFERVVKELEVFNQVIEVPILVIAFE